MATRRSTRRGSSSARDYPRTARLNELLREIVADELERIDDDRLTLLTVISVDIDQSLRQATVYFDCLDGAAGDAEAIEALESVRWRLQSAIGRQARTKHTPTLTFEPDPSVRQGELVDDILRRIEPAADDLVDGATAVDEPDGRDEDRAGGPGGDDPTGVGRDADDGPGGRAGEPG